jgi:hypothetical protein
MRSQKCSLVVSVKKAVLGADCSERSVNACRWLAGVNREVGIVVGGVFAVVWSGNDHAFGDRGVVKDGDVSAVEVGAGTFEDVDDAIWPIDDNRGEFELSLGGQQPYPEIFREIVNHKDSILLAINGENGRSEAVEREVTAFGGDGKEMNSSLGVAASNFGCDTGSAHARRALRKSTDGRKV